MQIEGEFPELLNIHDSLRKYVFEPNAARVSRGLRHWFPILLLKLVAEHWKCFIATRIVFL
jgi:hypothetical protein